MPHTIYMFISHFGEACITDNFIDTATKNTFHTYALNCYNYYYNKTQKFF